LIAFHSTTKETIMNVTNRRNKGGVLMMELRLSLCRLMGGVM
jgi:hypothetical protein